MEKQKEFIKKWLKEHKYCVLATSWENKPWAALAQPLKRKNRKEPNLLVKPKFLTFLKKEKSAKLTRISLSLK